MQLGVNEVDKQGVREEDGQRIIGLVGVEVWVAGEDVRSGEEATWDMDDLEVKVCEVEQPSCLSTVKILCLTEVRQVLVICENLYRERGPVEIVSPGLQGTDDGEEFSVVDVVVAFCWDERLGEVGTGVPVAIGVSLEEDSTRGVL